MFLHSPDPLGPVGGRETPREVAWNRRRWLRTAGLAFGAAGLTGGYGVWRYLHPDDDVVLRAGLVERVGDARSGSSGASDSAGAANVTMRRDERFAYGRPETVRAEAARYTNFYEFSRSSRSSESNS